MVSREYYDRKKYSDLTVVSGGPAPEGFFAKVLYYAFYAANMTMDRESIRKQADLKRRKRFSEEDKERGLVKRLGKVWT